MQLLVPDIFKQFSQITAAMSMRDLSAPDEFNMLLSGNDPKAAQANRRAFAEELGFAANHLVTLKQIHSGQVKLVPQDIHNQTEGDGLLTNQPGWLLGVTVADCAPVLLFDPYTNACAAVHSGPKGSALDIVGQAISELMTRFRVNPHNLYAWIGPAGGKDNYEVSYGVAGQFNPKYSQAKDSEHWLFDNKLVVCDQLKNAGVPEDQIEISTLNTITNQGLHSAQRDGKASKRMCAAIGLVH